MCPFGRYSLLSRPVQGDEGLFAPQLTVYVTLYPDVEKAIEVPMPEALYDTAEAAAEFSLSFGKGWVKTNARYLDDVLMAAASRNVHRRVPTGDRAGVRPTADIVK